jgi:hypothetical protein
MDFVDTTLVRLASDATRGSVFDQRALGQIAAAAYDANTLALTGPYTADFADFRLGLSAPAEPELSGTLQAVAGERTEVNLRARGFGDEPVPRIDALWRGFIGAKAIVSQATPESVVITSLDAAAIDAAIEAELGSLPTGQQLETQRRRQFLKRLGRAQPPQPGAMDDFLDDFLAGHGVATMREYYDRFGPLEGVRAARVTYPDLPETAAPRALPISAVLLIRDDQLSVAGLLAETRAVRERVRPLGLEAPMDEAARQKEPVVVVWVVPLEVFDDTDWPGGGTTGSNADRRDKRRVEAGKWLAREGIGLVATA